MSSSHTENPRQVQALLDLYDAALPEVYGYVRRRVDSEQSAEDITADVFLAAVAQLSKPSAGDRMEQPSVAWLIGIARHKVVDYWRRHEREQRRLDALTQAVAVGATTGAIPNVPDSDLVIEAHLAEWTLSRIAAPYRAALTLRYMDDLPVKQVAEHMERTPGATEALLTRAKAAFRQEYPVATDSPAQVDPQFIDPQFINRQFSNTQFSSTQFTETQHIRPTGSQEGS